MVSKQLIADVERHEGYSATVYRDSRGLPTIGFGQHDGVTLSTPPTDRESALAWLTQRLERARADVATLVGSTFAGIGPVRQDALTDLCYNMGRSTLAEFVPMLDAVSAGEWQSAATHLLTNSHGRLTPYLTQVGQRAVEVSLRIACGTILPEHVAP